MIFRIVYNGIDLMGSDLDSCVLNPSLEQELNTAGSLTFTMPPTHPMWGAMKVFVGDIEVYENGELIFFGRIVNIDQNWNNERIIECEGALAFFNDTYIDGHVRWDEEGTTVGSFFTDIVNRHNALVPDNRKIFVGNIDQSFMNYLVTREVEWEKTLDVISQMCIDTNGGWLMLRKDLEEDKIYIDWVKDITSGIDQPVQFGLNLLDVTKSYHGEDICTAVIPRGEQNDEGVYLDISEMPTVSDVGQVDHTYGSNILYHHEGVENHGAVLQVHDFSSCATKEDLYEEARVWLIKKNTDVATIEVEAAELGYFGDGYPIFKVGKLVEVIDGIHFPDETTVTYPMYKISMNLDSGKKQITIGTPPKKELTQIYASDVDSTGNGGVKSGTSSGGSGGSGSGDGVTDVIVNGSSVVNNHVASFSAVSTNQMNTAINNATSGLASTSYVDNAVAPKANASDVTSALALKADKTEIIDVVANPSGTGSTDLTKLKVGNDIYNIPSGGGGTEVEANPSEPATDDLNTIKIGETVYDIPGGGSTNYGKFKCDTLFVNDPLPSPTSGTANVTRTYTLNGSIDDYDAVYVIMYGYYYSSQGATNITSRIVFKNDYYLKGFDNLSYYDGIVDPNRMRRINFTFTDSTHIQTMAFRSEDAVEPILCKVYGLKFENKLINRSDIYSEEERMIGRWTDGKPLYQKTFKSVTSQQVNDWTVFDNVNTFYDTLVNVIQKVTFSNLDQVMANPDQNTTPRFAVKSDNKLYYYSDVSLNSDITIQYTKTTDAPGSGVIPEDPQMVMMSDYYSEEERVVGRWTDGKPLYQKTFTINTAITISNSWTDTDISKPSNCETVVQAEVYRLNHNGPIFASATVNDSNYIRLQTSISYSLSIGSKVTLRYTKSTDAPGTGPTPGNLIYLPALYSEEEREVGVWTDGKPLYQKTVIINNPSYGSSWTSISHGINNIDKVCLVEGAVKDSSTTYFINSYRPSINVGVVLGVNQTNINYINNWLENIAEISVTFQYTKTTDQPGSGTWTPEGQLAHHYSTSEKIVGTWIDGNTIYERTWDLGSSIPYTTSDAWEDTGITIPNAKAIYSGITLDTNVQTGEPNLLRMTQFYLNNQKVYIKFDVGAQLGGCKYRYITLQYAKSS